MRARISAARMFRIDSPIGSIFTVSKLGGC